MIKRFLNLKTIFLLVIIIFGILLISIPKPCKDGAISGLLLCGRIIIPSLFPFTMCVLYISKCGILDSISFIKPITNRLFGLNSYEFSVFFLSLIGGYPLGAKLINESVKDKKISMQMGRNMLTYCVNAGPAFIISAVGIGILGSQKIGLFLFLSHILASLVLCELSRFKKMERISKYNTSKPLNSADNFVISATEAADSVFKICSYVILFSIISEYVKLFQSKLAFLEVLGVLLEVTTAVTQINNIYLISFLLGFSGICIWCQVIAVTENIRPNFLKFALHRIAHGILSSAIMWLLIKVFNVELSVFSFNNSFNAEILYSTPSLAISIAMTAIIFVVSITTKKLSIKILEDVI